MEGWLNWVIDSKAKYTLGFLFLFFSFSAQSQTMEVNGGVHRAFNGNGDVRMNNYSISASYDFTSFFGIGGHYIYGKKENALDGYGYTYGYDYKIQSIGAALLYYPWSNQGKNLFRIEGSIGSHFHNPVMSYGYNDVEQTYVELDYVDFRSWYAGLGLQHLYMITSHIFAGVEASVKAGSNLVWSAGIKTGVRF